MVRLFCGGLLSLLVSSQVHAQLNMTLLGKLTYSQSLASLWGYAAGGKEYALVGAYGGLSIVDVTNPSTPTQVQFVATSPSAWHEIKTWSHYAYVVNETGGGLLIVDLSGLPGSAPYVHWTGGSLNLQTGHTLFIDEFGICYINGSNLANGGVIFLDLTIDPMNPVYLGSYTENYVHDCYVRNNIMYTSEIYKGWFRVVDVSNKSAPVVLAQQSTPGNFNHNTHLSDNGQYIFTTDEKSNSYVTSYNISNLSNITELDRFQANPGTNSIGHNVHVHGNYLVIAYYRDGVVIADAHNPANMIKVGEYDTSPFSGSGFNGCWEAYPYLPSGNIIASDIEQGLYVLGVTYQPACYLTGTVKDFSTNAALNGVSVSITSATGSETTTDLVGNYATGYALAGSYSVVFSKAGYHTKTITSVSLANGSTTVLNTTLKNTSLPACTIPSALSASSITSNSAVLSWSDEYASTYKVRLRNNATQVSQTFTTTTNTYTATGLSSCTSYKFRVKAKCSSTNTYTAYSSWYNFNTGGTTCKTTSDPVIPASVNIHCFPNPTMGLITVRVHVPSEQDAQLQIVDMAGKILASQTLHLQEGEQQWTVSLAAYPEGIYLLRLSTSDQTWIQRVLKH